MYISTKPPLLRIYYSYIIWNGEFNIFWILYYGPIIMSASVLLEYVNTEDELIENFRLRYNPCEGNDFYLVYNDFRGIDNRYTIPVPPPFFNKTIMVKYTHTFIL